MATFKVFPALALLCLLGVYGVKSVDASSSDWFHIDSANFTDSVLKDDYVWLVAVVSEQGPGVSASKEFTGSIMKGLAEGMGENAHVGMVEVGDLPLDMLDSYSEEKTRMRTPMLWLFKRAGKVYKDVPIIMGPDGHVEPHHLLKAAKEQLASHDSGDPKIPSVKKAGSYNWHPEL
mmetsp:Transcript_21501/g.25894  ORF Transcript_21501/g.25894 Transcript_21501/m.25894 type:complete len:176 (-) Transcript_21501:501-1028(-)|eukprot:CAMPEP_0197866372 /NCGR_PEP_ID=MMETSP1438-20131217/44181_1 /TAXON_ID=1461541 /ORGANISM="Pterosperma sp., Strain CCMP1384" /LENGTH=175 /DNA_ID=CAMNT_0043484937 /DNA_START=767 /DNA_END=1294 /DNA_ORIENTATION=-